MAFLIWEGLRVDDRTMRFLSLHGSVFLGDGLLDALVSWWVSEITMEWSVVLTHSNADDWPDYLSMGILIG